tara:strand:- start:3308 stop:3535 length:228 start_codon:yes stop_codon:yes gene_type:complete
MEIVAIILALGASFALGMYVITQIEKDIDKRTGSDYDVEPEFAKRKGFKCTQNEKLINNMNKIKTNGTTDNEGKG